MKMFEATVAEWEWKISRAQLKQADFKQALKEKADKEKGYVSFVELLAKQASLATR